MTDPTVQVFASCRPAVPSGQSLTIEVGQTLMDGATNLLALDGPAKVTVQVQGPRFVLGPADIAGEYPAPGSSDSPDEFLPHVALNRRTLPWERVGPEPSLPWLALLLVKESELVSLGGSSPGSTLEQLTIDEIGDRDGTSQTWILLSKPAIAASERLPVAFVPRGTLRAILPTQAELSLLCHMKRVRRTQTPQGGSPVEVVTDTAIVIGNRLPDSRIPEVAPGQAAPPKPELHHAMLVSLEKRRDLYDEALRPASETDDDKIAVVVLHHWSFRASAGGDFEQAMQEIRLRPNGGVLRFGNLPVDSGGGPEAFESLLDSRGYPTTPLSHSLPGEAVYRGPLCPFAAPARSSGFAVRAERQELTGDAEVHDYSYAAAFELGRLLALHDAGLLDDLREVRKTISPVTPQKAINKLPTVLQKKDWVTDIDDWGQPWSFDGQTSLVKDQAQLHTAYGLADALGAQAIEQLGEKELDKLNGMQKAQLEPVVSIDLAGSDGAILKAGLEQSYANLKTGP